MALIICPECGKQISDKAEHCIGCGYPLKYLVTEEAEVEQATREDTRTDMERLLDRIYARYPQDMAAGLREFRAETGLDLKTAIDMIYIRYKGKTPKEERKQIRHETIQGMFSTVPLRFARVSCCPKCRSVSIRYQEKNKGKRYAICMSCGNEWRM